LGPVNGRTKTIYSFFTNPPNPNVQYNYNPTFEIMIPFPRGPRGDGTISVKYLLEILIAEVKTVINQLIV